MAFDWTGTPDDFEIRRAIVAHVPDEIDALHDIAGDVAYTLGHKFADTRAIAGIENDRAFDAWIENHGDATVDRVLTMLESGVEPAATGREIEAAVEAFIADATGETITDAALEYVRWVRALPVA